MPADNLNAVLWIWGLTLAVITFVIVPLAVTLLRRASRASRSIAYYAQEMLAAGASIAGHTANVKALEATLATAGQLVAASGQLGDAAGRIHGALTAPKS
jgi:uncharacterized membrane protein YoaK (UPF0700 family)